MIRVGLPLAGVAAAFAGLALWVSSASFRALDGVVLALHGCGLALSAAGYLRTRDADARRLAVVGVGLSSAGAAMLVILYAAG
jgi:hypothetical protein